MPDQDALDMREVQRGRVDRFAHIVARHQSAMFRYASSRLASRSLAEDAVQETFLAAFRARNSFDTRRVFRAWLWTILVNTCRRMQKQDQRFPRQIVDDGAVEIPEPDTCPSGKLEKVEQQRQVAQMLRVLPDEQADAVRMHFFGELTYQEIGDVIQCPAATVKSRVRYGLTKLAETLRAAEEIVE